MLGLRIYCSFRPSSTPSGCSYPHFIDEETEALSLSILAGGSGQVRASVEAKIALADNLPLCRVTTVGS